MHFGSFMQTPSPNPLKGLRYLKVVVGGFQGPMGGGSDVLVSQREAASDKRLFPPTHDFPQEGSPHIILRPSGEARSIYIYTPPVRNFVDASRAALLNEGFNASVT